MPDCSVNKQYPFLINSAANAWSHWQALPRGTSSKVKEERVNKDRVDQGFIGLGHGSAAGHMGETRRYDCVRERGLWRRHQYIIIMIIVIATIKVSAPVLNSLVEYLLIIA